MAEAGSSQNLLKDLWEGNGFCVCLRLHLD